VNYKDAGYWILDTGYSILFAICHPVGIFAVVVIDDARNDLNMMTINIFFEVRNELF